MARLRRLLLAASVLAVLAGFASGRAHAASCPPGAFLSTVQSAHFIVAYDTDPTQTDYATQPQAQAIAAYAEQAYNTMTGMGFPAPAPDASGKSEITIADLSAIKPKTIELFCDGSAQLDVTDVGKTDEGYNVGAAVFFFSAQNAWPTSGPGDSWLLMGGASWASYKALGYPGFSSAELGPSLVSLDCSGSTTCVKNDSYASSGQSRWPFYEMLADRYGTTFLLSVLQKANLDGSALAGLEDALSAKGASLQDAFGDYAVKQMTGGWGIPALDTAPAPTTDGTFTTGTATGSLGSQTFSVAHLASRYVSFVRGDGKSDHPCFNATLTINVSIPAGVPARPFFYFPNSTFTPVALSVSGNTATTTIPWDTCAWASTGMLSLPNPTTNVETAWFTVSASVTVDTTSPATPAAPPAPATVPGSVVSVPTTEVAPSIEVFGPELLRVSPTDRTIRLIVQSSGDGVLKAALGDTALGTGSLRAGNNDLRFVVPKSLFVTLRRSATASNVLTLTPTSASGAVTGQAVTRRVTLPAVPKPSKHKR